MHKFAFNQKLQVHRDFLVHVSLNPTSQTIKEAQDDEILCIIQILKKLFFGEIGLSRNIYSACKRKKAFSTLQDYFQEHRYKDKTTHRDILIKSVGILKQLLDPIW